MPTDSQDGSSTVGYLVVGPESSGTRLVAELLRTAGCRSVAIIGHHDGPELPRDGRPPLVRRSLPHDFEWFAIPDLVRLLDTADAYAVVTTRDWFAMAESQVSRQLARDLDMAFANIRRAYRDIFTGLAELEIPFIVSSYEAMVAESRYGRRLLEALGLPAAAVDTYEGNSKWYGIERAETGPPAGWASSPRSASQGSASEQRPHG